MLSKKYRLNRRQVQQVLKKGRGQNFGGIGVKSLPNNLSYSRYAVVVPKVVSKKATERNRLRRIVYEDIYSKKNAGCDFIIRIYKMPSKENAMLTEIKTILDQNV